MVRALGEVNFRPAGIAKRCSRRSHASGSRSEMTRSAVGMGSV